MQLNLSHIECTHPGASSPALKDVTVTFPRGWTGIVGDNGGGKTTLARIVCALTRPDSGVVSPVLVATYCPQDPTDRPENLEDLALSYNKMATKLRRDLQIEDDWPWRYDTLSCGQQKRLQIACALWREPDVIAIDEPTNHVDTTTKDAILKALGAFTGIGLLVSHDRELLDALCEQCLFVANGTATMRPGNYSQASSQATLERDSTIAARNAARKEKSRLEKEAQRRREEASRTAGKRSLKNIAKHDNDARHTVRMAVISGKDGVAGKLSARMDSRLARAEETLASMHVEKCYEGDIWMDVAPARRKTLFRCAEQAIPLGSRTLLVPPLHIGNSDHIGIVGNNGIGKTTLVRTIVASLSVDVKALYLPQEPNTQETRAALNSLRQLPAHQRGKALSIVAQLNSDPDRVLEGDVTSPGELRKVMIALGILQAPDLIIMDEPTNHLDLGSITALERMLVGFPGALLLVSHDPALIQAATRIAWRLEADPHGRSPVHLTIR